jgi:hypothetical protein
LSPSYFFPFPHLSLSPFVPTSPLTLLYLPSHIIVFCSSPHPFFNSYFTGYILPDRLRGRPYFTGQSVRDYPDPTIMIMMTHRSIGTYALLAVQYSGLHYTTGHRVLPFRSALVVRHLFLHHSILVSASVYLPLPIYLSILSHVLILSPLSLSPSLYFALFFLLSSFSSRSDESCQRSVRSHFSAAQSVRSSAPSNVSTA